MFHETKGVVTRQAHTNIPEGTYEDEHGRQGFFGRVSHLYHQNPPTNWKKIEGPCRPQCFNLLKSPAGKDPWQCEYVLKNEDVKLGLIQTDKAMPYYFRNGDGDMVYFIHEGKGLLECEYGPLNFERGDYLVLPKGTTYRMVPEGAVKVFTVEARGEINLPDKGLLGKHALFDPAMIETPKPQALSGKGEFQLKIKRQEQFTTVTYGFNPLDVVGWKGDLSPFKVNIKNFLPVMSHRYHIAPSVHATFVGAGFVLCSFVPRPFESDPKAQRVPFYHRNIDSDEVIFYHEGNFFSRKNMNVGMLTFHPFGIHHGPHPGAAEAAKKKEATDEYAVMVDTFRPLNPTAAGEACEWKEYHLSWKQD